MSVRCGNKVHEQDVALIHHHDSVAQVRVCFARGLASNEEVELESYEAAQAEAEFMAEQGYERWLESGGAQSDIIAYENDMERRMAAEMGEI